MYICIQQLQRMAIPKMSFGSSTCKKFKLHQHQQPTKRSCGKRVKRNVHVDFNVVNGSIFSEKTFHGVPLGAIWSVLVTNPWHVDWSFLEKKWITISITLWQRNNSWQVSESEETSANKMNKTEENMSTAWKQHSPILYAWL